MKKEDEKSSKVTQITNVKVESGGLLSGFKQGTGCCLGIIFVIIILVALIVMSGGK